MLLPDALTDILQSIHLQSTILGTALFTAPWSVRIPDDDHDEATIHVVMQGQCWLFLELRSQLIHLEAGDLVVLLQGQEHILCDDPASPTVNLEAVIARKPDPGYKQLAYGGGGSLSQLVSGTFKFRGDRTHNPLLLALPEFIHVKNETGQLIPWLETTLQFIASEIEINQLGCQCVLSRLADVLFIQAVRAYVAELPVNQANWLRALTDIEIGMALSLIHHYPNRAWTVASLAEQLSMSRSTFAERFNQLVGQPPVQYLTTWRMVKAAELLRESQFRIREIGAQVGYTSEVSFSKAFKKWAGTAPGVYRRTYYAQNHIESSAV
ncbi:MAG: AraC family transcriptional regulator [Stenomitos rutilans HA7619-LM2]|jgi:AraC-like DNA-binding protein|nr:AraC family transcriptional regulator [Stenomitos rutilans HA7619-LM2]